ncbi:FxSxx-COOH protein [Streptosporangium sp. NBC_01755]|uniref:FxSxx-COOH cyclophane-containing RiPP peptide n=1 Tax=unclassified Streptosporangium TaxID=2632669 RepID=UPI002DD888A1|nr:MULTISPECIES: FxSxx-COOH cyclophane-containing RiPP peptide [unclassified Streptosporangium]WSA27787.1 FxSxx-COOH protein [Streptosporangium sp. NBC_01810]WSD00738.1 FxSxx-COOH protein [Streptosporangium sp. NBC_01755]
MGEEVITGEIDSIESVLIDVTGLSLTDLDHIDDSHLKRALRRILDNDDTGPAAGFTSSI